MNQMEMIILLSVVITFCATIVLFGLIFFMTKLFNKVKMDRNPIDIIEFECIGNSYKAKFGQVGRIKFIQDKGWRLVSCGFLPNSVDRDFGERTAHEQYMISSSKGGKRKTILIATKDRISTPLGNIENKKLSDKQINVIKEIYEKYKTENIDINKILKDKKISKEELKKLKEVSEKEKIPIDLGTAPESLSITPIMYEQEDFAIKEEMIKNELYRNKRREEQLRAMTWLTGIVCVVLILGSMIISGFMVTKSTETSNVIMSKTESNINWIPYVNGTPMIPLSEAENVINEQRKSGLSPS